MNRRDRRADPFYRQAPKDRLGDAPLERRHYEELARVLDAGLNGMAQGAERQHGFVLMIFPFGDRPGRCNYVSNCADRADVVALMKEMIARFEGQPEVEGNA